MQLLPRLQLEQEALIVVAGRRKEYPVDGDDQLVEGRVERKSLAETHLYEPNNSHLP